MATWFVNEGESIQAAINSAAAGDTIMVGAGTYNESIVINKDVTVRADNSAAETIINGQGTNPNFSFAVQITAAGATFGTLGHGFTVNAGPNAFLSARSLTSASKTISSSPMRAPPTCITRWSLRPAPRTC